MRLILLLVLSTEFAQVATNVQSSPLPTPVVGPLDTQTYKQFKIDPTLREYQIGDVYVMPSGEWILFYINSNFKNPRQSEVVAVGAHHIATGRKRQFTFSFPRGSSSQDVSIVESLRPDFVPVGHNRVGVVSRHRARLRAEFKSPKGDSGVRGGDSYFLWEWNLDGDKARLLGPWEYAMIPIAQALQMQQCDVCWTSKQGHVTGVLDLTDLGSGARTAMVLNPEVHVTEMDMQTYRRTSEPCAFAVCDPLPRDAVSVYCIDPNANNGVRWRLTTATLEKTTRRYIAGAAFLQNDHSLDERLPLLVSALTKGDLSVHLVFVEERTGKIAGARRIPVDDDMTLPIISTDHRCLVARLHSDEENREDESFDGDLSERLRVIDLDTRQYRDTRNVLGIMTTCYLRGFINTRDAIVSDDHAIWILDTGKDLRFKQLFRLNWFPGWDDEPPGENEKGD